MKGIAVVLHSTNKFIMTKDESNVLMCRLNDLGETPWERGEIHDEFFLDVAGNHLRFFKVDEQADDEGVVLWVFEPVSLMLTMRNVKIVVFNE